MKQEIESHLHEKEILESVIPSSIIIGPFWVNVENVRQALSKKRKALSNAVLELLARKLRQQSDEVSFQCMNAKLLFGCLSLVVRVMMTVTQIFCLPNLVAGEKTKVALYVLVSDEFAHLTGVRAL